MRFIFGFIFAFVLCGVIGFGTLYFGLCPVNADADPSWIENKFAHFVLDGYVSKQAKDLPQNAFKPTADVLMQGMKIFKSNCAGCHGSPTDKEGAFGKAFYPKAPQFWKEGLDDDPRELFWITKHGIRMSGMPSMKGLMKDEDIWKVVTFIGAISKLPQAVKVEWQKVT